MPLYALTCAGEDCGHKWEEVCQESMRFLIPCPKCGRHGARQLPCENMPRLERRFSGAESQSVTEGWHPREVGQARALMPSVQHCIKDDGRVEFADRAEQRRYVRELGRLYRSAPLQPADPRS